MNSKNKRVLTMLYASNELMLFFIILCLIIFIGIKAPQFLTVENMFDIFKNSSFIGICSIGFLIVLISGGIDISFTATATMAQYMMALVLTRYNVPVVVVIAIPMIIGIILGSINAVLIMKTKAPAIIITIGTLNVYYGIVQFISNGRWLYDFPDWFRLFSRVYLIHFVNADGNNYGVSIFTGIWFLVAVIGAFILHKTVLGRKIFAIGGNVDAARRAGVNIYKTRLFCYAFLGLVAGLGSVIHAMTTQTVAPNAIINQNFDVLAAVVIGGANIMGGGGSIIGTTLGVLLIALIKNGLTIMKIPAYWHQVLVGALLLTSVAIAAMRTRQNIFRKGGIDVE